MKTLYIILLIFSCLVLASLLIDLFRINLYKSLKAMTVRDWLMLFILFIAISLSLIFLF